MAKKQKEARQEKQWDVEIGFEPSNGKFTYESPGASDPTELEVDPGDKITWRANHPFAVLFEGADTPCEEEGKSGKMMVGSAGPGKILKVKVRDGTEGQRYKYWVAMNIGGTVETDDPAILVRF